MSIASDFSDYIAGRDGRFLLFMFVIGFLASFSTSTFIGWLGDRPTFEATLLVDGKPTLSCRGKTECEVEGAISVASGQLLAVRVTLEGRR